MTKLIVTLAIGILAFAANSSAQTVTRIKFAKGQSSTVVRGTTGPEGISYVLKAKGGQKVILRLTPASGVGIKVESDRSYGHVVLLKAKKGGSYEMPIEETGDCTIFIGTTKAKPMPFTMTIKVIRMGGDI